MVDCGSGRASQFNMARARDHHPSPRCIADTKRHLFFSAIAIRRKLKPLQQQQQQQQQQHKLNQTFGVK
jgi:hypothetical protein